MNFVIKEIVKPLGRRLGTLVAGGLLTIGATQDVASQVELCIPALLALLADLILSHRGRA